MAQMRSRRHVRTLSGASELELPSGRRLAVQHRIRIEQHLIDGTPGTFIWAIGLVLPSDSPLKELLDLFNSDDTALLDVARDEPPWQVRVSLFEAPPMPWSSPATLRFHLDGNPPSHLLDPS